MKETETEKQRWGASSKATVVEKGTDLLDAKILN